MKKTGEKQNKKGNNKDRNEIYSEILEDEVLGLALIKCMEDSVMKCKDEVN